MAYSMNWGATYCAATKMSQDTYVSLQPTASRQCSRARSQSFVRHTRKSPPIFSSPIPVSTSTHSMPKLPSARPSEQLVGRKICDVGFGLYVSRELLASTSELAADSLPTLGLGGPLATSSLGQWLDKSTHSGPTVMRCDSFIVLLALAEAGAGCTILPCWLGETSPHLTRIGPDLLEFRNHLWVLHHRDVRRSGRVRIVTEAVTTALRAKRQLIEGSVIGSR